MMMSNNNGSSCEVFNRESWNLSSKSDCCRSPIVLLLTRSCLCALCAYVCDGPFLYNSTRGPRASHERVPKARSSVSMRSCFRLDSNARAFHAPRPRVLWRQKCFKLDPYSPLSTSTLTSQCLSSHLLIRQKQRQQKKSESCPSNTAPAAESGSRAKCVANGNLFHSDVQRRPKPE